MSINFQYYNKLTSLIRDISDKPIINILKNYGKVYLVGGAIRSILGDEKPNDIDLFVTMDVEDIIDLIDDLKKENFAVRHELKYDYEGWSMKDLSMIHPTHNITKESYDIVIGYSPSTHAHDFDVNSLFIELKPNNLSRHTNSILHISESKTLESISDVDLQTIIEHIKEKTLSFACTIESLQQNANTVHGPGQLMKRLMKRINYGWTIVNCQENINIVEYLLNVVHPSSYRQVAFVRECELAIANLMKFTMNVNFDLKSFIRETDAKVVYFTETLNMVSNKRTKMFDTELCKKIMTYCDLKYEKWDVNGYEYMGVYSSIISET